MESSLKEVTIRIPLRVKGDRPNNKVWVEMPIEDAAKVGEMIMESPEKYSGEEAALNAYLDLLASKTECVKTISNEQDGYTVA